MERPATLMGPNPVRFGRVGVFVCTDGGGVRWDVRRACVGSCVESTSID